MGELGKKVLILNKIKKAVMSRVLDLSKFSTIQKALHNPHSPFLTSTNPLRRNFLNAIIIITEIY